MFTKISKIWVSNIGGELINMDMRDIYINRRVCHNHFEDIYKYPKNKLGKLATPILGLQGKVYLIVLY